MSQTRPDYKTYMASDEWKRRRQAAFQRAASRNKYYFPVCEICGRYGVPHKNRRSSDNPYQVEGTNGLQVHHVHYRNLGHEEPNDLIVLCTDVCFLDAHMSVPPSKRGAFPDRVGCHERCHDDRYYRDQVALIAGAR